MAKIIDFYIPQRFRKVAKWLLPNERGKLLEFPVAIRKSVTGRGDLMATAYRAG